MGTMTASRIAYRGQSIAAARPTISISHRLLLIAIALSPLQKALTIEAGFPLKLCELAIIAALVLAPFSRGTKKTGLTVERTLIVALLVVTVLSTAFALVTPTPAGPFSGYGRSIGTDAVLYLGYSAMVLLAWFIMIDIDPVRFRRAVGVAVRVCTAFCALQFVLWSVGSFELLRFFGFELVLGSTFGSPVPRNGPFMEGNYLGFFAGLALMVCLRSKDVLGVVLATACLLYSQSTNAILAVVAGLILTLLLRPQVRWASLFGFVGLVIALAIAAIPRVQAVLAFQLSKLGLGSESAGADTSRSIAIRSGKSATGSEIAFDHPLFGVGPGRFGVWFAEYADPGAFPVGYLPLRGRAITENAYIQMGSEIGLIALLVFAALLAVQAFRAFRANRLDFALAIYFVFALNAAPSWTTVTIWVGLAYLGVAARESASDPGLAETVRRDTIRRSGGLSDRAPSTSRRVPLRGVR